MNRLYNLIATSGVCAVSGAIAGSFVGGLFGLVEAVTIGAPSMPMALLLEIALGLSLVAWVVVLLIVGVFGNYGAVAIAIKALATCLIAGLLSVVLIHFAHAGLFGMLLGWVVGFLVGKFLCAACSASQRKPSDDVR